MKPAFFICAILFVVMYIGAQATLPQPKHDGIVRLHWATDPNPARIVQTALFDKMYPGITATVDPSAGGDTSKVLVQCATGVGPDLIDAGPDSMHTLVDAGILLDLTPYAKKMGFDPSHTYPSIASGLEVNGHQYRFPRNVWANCVIYNKAVFRDHGVPYPQPNWTFAQFVRAAQEIQNNKSKTGQQNLAIANYSGQGIYDDFLIGHGGRLFTPDGLHSAVNSPASIAALQAYYDLIYKYHVVPTPADSASMSSQGGWGSGGINWFSQGKAAMIMIGRWYIIQVPNFHNLTGNLGSVLLPRFGDLPSAGVGDSGAVGINAKSPHIKQALDFLQFLSSPQYSKIIVADGDSLPPNPKLALNGQALADSLVPDPAFHAPFVQAIKNARPLDYSPFIDASEVSRWIGDSVAEVENQLQTPAQALNALAAQIDQEIRLNLQRQPALQKLYEQRSGRSYRTDWR
jgi:multiple sugar transport system substrate-binding protein